MKAPPLPGGGVAVIQDRPGPEALLATAPLKLRYQNPNVALAMCNAAVEVCGPWRVDRGEGGGAEELEWWVSFVRTRTQNVIHTQTSFELYSAPKFFYLGLPIAMVPFEVVSGSFVYHTRTQYGDPHPNPHSNLLPHPPNPFSFCSPTPLPFLLTSPPPQLAPQRAACYTTRGAVYLSLGQTAQAHADYTMAINLRPRGPSGLD